MIVQVRLNLVLFTDRDDFFEYVRLCIEFGIRFLMFAGPPARLPTDKPRFLPFS